MRDPQAKPDEPDWTFKQTLEFLQRSPPFLYERIRDGSIRAYKQGDRTMIDPETVRAYRRSRPLVLPTRAKPSKPATPKAKKRKASPLRAKRRPEARAAGAP